MNVSALAFAKLNLNLEVVKRRDDGYHEIRSIVQTIDLADRLTFADASGISVVCDAPIDGMNLAERAARAVLEQKGAERGVRIELEKRIPMGAGLGGGSSDAAAVLAILNRWIPPRLDEDDLRTLAAAIGADVPLFLEGGCLELGGLGEPRRRLAGRTETFVVLVPQIHCATAEVYRAWMPVHIPDGAGVLGRNDLATAAVRLHPELSAIAEVVRELGGAYEGLSGSGSAFYAAFAERGDARAAWEKLSGQLADVRVYCCESTTVGHAEEGDHG
jgi:4-diphosphocytidyl-2-C-methyl-D-erythritol kinase